MSELPSGADPGLDLEVAAPRQGSIERRRSAELTVAEKAIRRRNRKWLAGLTFPALIVGAAALIATLAASSSGPAVSPSTVPPGFKAVNDGYFAYSVPSQWTTDNLYTDNAGDLDTSGATGWVGEHVGVRATPPVPGEARPAALAAFGVDRPMPYAISAGVATKVTGASTAFRYVVTRPAGFRATVIDAWQSNSGAEMWLMVQAPPGVTDQILSTLKG